MNFYFIFSIKNSTYETILEFSYFHKNKTMAEYFDDFIQKELESTINFDEAYDELELLKLKIAEKLDVDSFFVKVQELTTPFFYSKALLLHINKIIDDIEKAVEYIEDNFSFSIAPDRVQLILPHPLFLLQVPYSSSLLSSLSFLNEPALEKFNDLTQF